MARMTLPGTVERPGVHDEGTTQRERWVVVVYDNDTNTFDEVIAILMLATGCGFEEASIETWEVHNLGKSVVHCDGEQACRRVAEVIESIGIRTEVRED